MKYFEIGICKVCASSKTVKRLKESGTPACAACKKFFVRNCMSPRDLVCMKMLPGLNCLADSAEAGGQHNIYKLPSTKRIVLCPKCRYDKCLEIGMQIRMTRSALIKKFRDKTEIKKLKRHNDCDIEGVSDRSNSVGSFSRSAKTTCLSDDAKDVETAATAPELYVTESSAGLTKIPANESNLTAFSFNESFRILEGLSKISLEFDCDVYSMSLVWPKWSRHINQTIKICSDFVKTLPGFLTLTMNDRELLFKSAFLPITLAYFAKSVNGDSPFFGFSGKTQSVLFFHVPCFQLMKDRALEIEKVLHLWNPSFEEFALLEGILFYKYSSSSKLDGPDIVDQYRRSLMAAMYARMQASGEINLFQMSLFKDVVYLLTSTNDLAGQFHDAIAKHPEVNLDDPLFSEMFAY